LWPFLWSLSSYPVTWQMLIQPIMHKHCINLWLQVCWTPYSFYHSL
jgi:hypothetical protein